MDQARGRSMCACDSSEREWCQEKVSSVVDWVHLFEKKLSNQTEWVSHGGSNEDEEWANCFLVKTIPTLASRSSINELIVDSCCGHHK